MKATSVVIILMSYSILTLPGQNIIALEYFIDQDPGYGMATSILISPDDSPSLDIKVPMEDILPGIHKLYLRSKDDTGIWSFLAYQIFELLPGSEEAISITGLEYFVDTDPGYGSANPVAISAGSNPVINMEVPNDDLTPGIHKVYLRSRDDAGQWSHLDYLIYEVLPHELDDSISFLEFFVDRDPGVGSGTVVPIETSDTVSAHLQLELLSLDQGIHKIYFRSRSKSGNWSLMSFRIFEVLDSLSSSAEIVAVEYILPLSEGDYRETTHYFVADTLIDEDVQFSTIPHESGKGIIYARGIDARGERGLWIPVDSFTITECEIVFNTLNDGNGSLRFALNCVNPGDTIHFAPNMNNHILELQLPEISLNKDVVIWSTSGANITLSNLDADNTESLLSTCGLLRIHGISLAGKSSESFIITLKSDQGEFEIFDGDLEKVTIENQE